MPFRRLRHRRWIALLALLGLLFQQLAMAAYVCPIDVRAALSAPTADELPPCHQPQNADKARCHAHCHPLTPSADHAPAPTVPAALLPATPWLRGAARQSAGCDLVVAREVTARATAPPLTVQHCTFQI
jgi:hypothetical protein